MVEKHDRPVFCPRCRIAMVWVDADAEGFNRYSCPNCGGVVEHGPESSNCLPKWSVSSRIVGDIFAHPRVHAPGIVESHRDPVGDQASRADANGNRQESLMLSKLSDHHVSEIPRIDLALIDRHDQPISVPTKRQVARLLPRWPTRHSMGAASGCAAS
jgi:Zn-finger nucleic acid-binding protein